MKKISARSLGFWIRCFSILLMFSTVLINLRLIQTLTSSTTAASSGQKQHSIITHTKQSSLTSSSSKGSAPNTDHAIISSAGEPEVEAVDTWTDTQWEPVWKSSTVLPRWMKEYFAWHAEQRRLLAQQQQDNGTSHDDDFKFLVVRCLQHDEKCGGTADRLKPLPFYLRLAHRLQRILLFKWERPVPLEEFLQPPMRRRRHVDGDPSSVVVGMDWRWPAFLDETINFTDGRGEPEIYNAKHIKQYSGWDLPRSYNQKDAAQAVAHTNQTQSLRQKPLPQAVVSMRYQTHSHGADEYDWLVAAHNLQSDEQEATFAQVFRDAWHAVFEPVPAIQQRIDETIQRTWGGNVQPNTYDAVHIRALYHSSQPGINALRSLSRHAVNCLHNLQLQQQQHDDKNTNHNVNSTQFPMFIASDDIRASDLAHAYAAKRGVRTLRVISDNATESAGGSTNETAVAQAQSKPIHLDRGTNFLARRVENWTTHEASRYYDVFVDLYLLANARCITYNVGNFGKWANLLSLHPECEVSHMKNKCPWNE